MRRRTRASNRQSDDDRPSEPRWLSLDEVVAINAIEVSETGEPHGLGDTGLLESALARPRDLWAYGEGDLPRLAASLCAGIARNRPFLHGNRRTAATAALAFTALNGYHFQKADDEDLGLWVQALARRMISEASFAELLAARLEPL